jgi:heme exporter protein A
MLTCHNLHAIRGEKLLFSHLGFSLQAGSALVLRGANGSGKSTLLRLLAGIMTPAQGSVQWQNQPIQQNHDYLQSMLYIGHQNALKPELSVYDNIQYWASLRGTEMLVPAAMQFFDLWKIEAIPAGQLSAGWQRRVALARLLAMPSRLWLLDEPAANLDAEGAEMLDGLIATRVKQDGIVVLASHTQTTYPSLHIEDFCGFLKEPVDA